MEFDKNEFLNGLQTDNPALKQFIEGCGFFYDEETGILHMVGPQVPGADISGITELLSVHAGSWFTAKEAAFNGIKVKAGASEHELDLPEYEKFAANQLPADLPMFTDHTASESPVVGGETPVIPGDPAAIKPEGEDTPYDFLYSDIAKDAAREGAHHDEAPNVQNMLPNDHEQEHAPTATRPAGVLDFIGGALAGAGIATAAGMKSPFKSLADWRGNRPQEYIKKTEDLVETLEKNLTAFNANEKFIEIEAELKARGGWDPEVGLRFDAAIHENALMLEDWNKMRDQMKELQSVAKKAASLSKDNPEAASEKIDSLIARVSKAAGKIPFSMDHGNVTETFAEAAERLRDQIARIINKISKFISNVFGKAGTPATP